MSLATSLIVLAFWASRFCVRQSPTAEDRDPEGEHDNEVASDMLSTSCGSGGESGESRSTPGSGGRREPAEHAILRRIACTGNR